MTDRCLFMPASASLPPISAIAVRGKRTIWRHLITSYVIAIIMLGVAITGVSKTFTENAAVGLLVCPTLLFVTPRSWGDKDSGESYG